MDPQIRHYILTHQVVMVDGILDEILPLIPARQRCEIFSTIRMDLSRVTSVLKSKQWDGSVPVVVFVGCETWIHELALLILDRQANQAVVWITDGSPHLSSAIKNIAKYVSSKRPNTSLSHLLRTGSYREVVERADLDTLFHQLHAFSSDIEQLSIADLLLVHAPSCMTEACLPPMPSRSTYVSDTPPERRIQTNRSFVRIVQSLVARRVGTMLRLNETLSYIQYAHQIQTRPEIAQHPRDDCDPRLIQNINDRILLMATMPTRGSKRSVHGETKKSMCDLQINVL